MYVVHCRCPCGASLITDSSLEVYLHPTVIKASDQRLMLIRCHVQDPNTVRAHFHARGRASTPFYVVSQVQSCNMSPLGLWGFGLTTALLQVRPFMQSACSCKSPVSSDGTEAYASILQ